MTLNSLKRDSYGVVLVLLLGAGVVALGGALAGHRWLAAPALLDAAVACFLASGMLAGTLQAQFTRGQLAVATPMPDEEPDSPAPTLWMDARFRLKVAQTALALVGMTAAGMAAGAEPGFGLPLGQRGAAATLLVLAAWLATVAAQYLATIEPAQLPEALGLARGGRVLALMLVSCAAGVALDGAGWNPASHFLHLAGLAAMALALIDLVNDRRDPSQPPTFRTELVLFSLLGRRSNPVASALEAAHEQLGIDLRSSWALEVIRRGAGPILAATLLLGWLSTALTVVALDEQGLLERFGVPRQDMTLDPGLHLHWPWPVERVLRIPVRQIQTLHVGHADDTEQQGPEDVLWARQRAAQEYTLLLGNGRDLVSVDATVQFRIADPRAWQYRCDQPAAMLGAICYRAVMKTTVNRTLSDVLSENVAVVTGQMRAMVQRDADSEGLGVEVLAFQVGGMHPPVPVAPAYEAVNSAQLAGTTATIAAHAFWNSSVPAAQAEAERDENVARAASAQAVAEATGQAAGFLTLEPVYRADPQGFTFRRRLETLEDVLPHQSYTVMDARLTRDGGELWLMK